MSPPQELTFGDWNSDTASSTNIDIQGDTFTLATTIGDTIVDNFEDADADPAGVYESGKTLADYYTDNGELANASRDTTRAIDGSKSYRSVNSDRGDFIYSPAGSGLPRYPQKGEIFQAYFFNNNDDQRGAVGFGINGSGSGYWMHIFGHNNLLRIAKGTASAGYADNILSSTSVSIGADDWFVGEVEWHDGSGSEPDNTIVLRLYDTDANNDKGSELASVTASDSEFASETGVGLGQNNNNNTEGWIDLYEVIGGV